MASRTIPVAAGVDVVVVGGASAGVAAASEAGRAGRQVFLGAAETYLGEDICATGRLWLPPEVPIETALGRALFCDAHGQRLVPVRPMDVKRRLDEELLDSGVQFLFGVAPLDILVDDDGRLAGVVFTSRMGPFAVTARTVIDATPFGLLARLAGVPFTPWAGGPITFRRVLVGHRAESDAGSHGEALPGAARGSVGGREIGLPAFRYTFELPVAAITPAAIAAAEAAGRDQAWHKDVAWSSDRLDWLPPDAVGSGRLHPCRSGAEVDLAAFASTLPGMHVLGPAAAVSRADAELLRQGPHAIAAGIRLGAAVAVDGGRVTVPCRPRRVAAGNGEEIREHAQPSRMLAEATAGVPAPAADALPVIGTFDVVVVGGGTGGAPAAIAAARSGSRTLLLESLHGLGGVGTLGAISVYYHGNRAGFTAEVTEGLRAMAGKDATFLADRWNAEHKSEWFRRQLRAAGGEIWFGALVSGCRTAGSRVTGVVVNTPWGRGLVTAGSVVDATGNADVAAAAGAPCTIVSEHDLAVQGTGLPSRPFVPGYHNTDYTFVDDTDLGDVTRAFVVARRRFSKDYDLAQIVDTRERRQIVGDVCLTPIDVYTGRTWADAICLSQSNFDSHGFTVHPLFFVLPPDRTSLSAWLPLRALLPQGISGLLVTGLAISGQRDVMPVYRMQPDIQNHAYAAGIAASMALARKGEVRRIDTRSLQRQLVRLGILPQTALLCRDGATPPRPVLQAAATGPLDIHAELAALMAAPEGALLLLRQRLAEERDPAARVTCARLLGVMGEACGSQVLLEAVRSAAGWDSGWNYTGMGQFGRSLSPMDDCIMALAAARVGEAKPVVLEKIRQLGPDPALSHVRAVAVYCESFGDAECASALAEVLKQPGMGGHAWTRISEELANIPPSTVDTTTRNAALRELYLARALWRCGDRDGLGAATLGRYSHDIRGHFARHSRRVLANGPGR